MVALPKFPVAPVTKIILFCFYINYFWLGKETTIDLVKSPFALGYEDKKW
jgi:hypothetical protein